MNKKIPSPNLQKFHSLHPPPPPCPQSKICMTFNFPINSAEPSNAQLVTNSMAYKQNILKTKYYTHTHTSELQIVSISFVRSAKQQQQQKNNSNLLYIEHFNIFNDFFVWQNPTQQNKIQPNPLQFNPANNHPTNLPNPTTTAKEANQSDDKHSIENIFLINMADML